MLKKLSDNLLNNFKISNVDNVTCYLSFKIVLKIIYNIFLHLKQYRQRQINQIVLNAVQLLYEDKTTNNQTKQLRKNLKYVVKMFVILYVSKHKKIMLLQFNNLKKNSADSVKTVIHCQKVFITLYILLVCALN